jgi:hypothetical protein
MFENRDKLNGRELKETISDPIGNFCIDTKKADSTPK